MINLPFKSLWNYQYQKNENSSINKYNLIFKGNTMIAEVMKKMYKKGCSLINRLIFDKIIVAKKGKWII